MAGLFSVRWLDPNALPRLEYRGSLVDGRQIFIDRHGGEWRVVDYVGGDGCSIEECRPLRAPRSNVQYRLFLLQPLERSARLYAFEIEERRDFSVYDIGRLEGQWSRGAMVRFPSLRPIDPRAVIVRGHLHK